MKEFWKSVSIWQSEATIQWRLFPDTVYYCTFAAENGDENNAENCKIRLSSGNSSRSSHGQNNDVRQSSSSIV